MGGKTTNHLRQALRKFGAVQNWQLLLILIPLMFVAATLLRLDHLRMAELREAVLTADANGDNDATNAALEKLQQFVFTHVVVNVVEQNGVQRVIFGTGPFYLEQQYLRDAEAAILAAEQQVVDDSNPNGNIYAAVSAICRPQAIANHWNWNSQGYLDCWTSELAKFPASDELSNDLSVTLPSTALYRRSFASPIWAPSWAGWVILLCLILAIIIIIRGVIWLVLQIPLLIIQKKS